MLTMSFSFVNILVDAWLRKLIGKFKSHNFAFRNYSNKRLLLLLLLLWSTLFIQQIGFRIIKCLNEQTESGATLSFFFFY